MPLAIIVTLILALSTIALTSRNVQGFLSGVFQGQNRDARDVAESAISDFGVTMNREENRLLLVAGNGATWTDTSQRNPCTSSTLQADGTWSALSSDSATALANSTAISASKFIPSDTWQTLTSGDTSRAFKVSKVEYYYESASGVRTPYTPTTQNDNFSTATPKTVRDSAIEGGTRTLVRVTVIGRVVRDGQTSYARVAREFEVVPKCCKRSFGRNLGAVAWGRDSATCPVVQGNGLGAGLIGSMDGGSPRGSNNQLDIRDENNQLLTEALCWAGNDPAKPSDLNGTPNSTCLDGLQSLGASSTKKAGVKFVPTPFSLKLPNPQWVSGGRLAVQSSATLTASSLNTSFPYASFGTWIADGSNYWMKKFDQSWIQFDSALVAKPWTYASYSRVSVTSPCATGNRVQISTSPLSTHGLAAGDPLYLYSVSGSLASGDSYSVNCLSSSQLFNINNTSNVSGVLLWMTGVSTVSPRTFANCLSSTTDFSRCRWEGNSVSSSAGYPQASISVNPLPGTAEISRSTPSYTSTTRIYLDPNSLVMMQQVGSAAAVPMTNCVVNRAPSDPYAVVDCRFRNISSGNNNVIVDTTYAMVNFHFDDVSYTGEYMGGSGSTTYKRVQCDRASWTSSCNTNVDWTAFQKKCDPAETNKDANCSVANRKYDSSELWNVYASGAGGFFFNGGSGVAGPSVYAPLADITLKGGGSPNTIDFMGRFWGDSIGLNGNVNIRVPATQAAFCIQDGCPTGAKVPRYDVVGRSYSHASGF